MKRYRNKQTGEVVEAADVQRMIGYYVCAPSGITFFYPPEKFRETFDEVEEAVEVVLLGKSLRTIPGVVYRSIGPMGFSAVLERREDHGALHWICEVSHPLLVTNKFSFRRIFDTVCEVNRFAANCIKQYFNTGIWDVSC